MNDYQQSIDAAAQLESDERQMNFNECRIREFDLDMNTIIRSYAISYLSTGCDNDTLDEAADQAALDMKGMDAPHEIKRIFRDEVRRLERSGRGGW